MLVLVDTNTLGIKIIKEITALIAAAACMVPIAFFAPGFARESAAVALPSGKLHAGIDNGSLAPDSGCSADPWPYGCDWRASGPAQIAKRAHNRHHGRAVTTVSGKGFASGDEL